MSRRARFLLGAAAVTLALTAFAERGEAHKPITSPFTFNEDVLPIIRQRCAACHVAGGVAPMSLLTHPEAVPWGESIRLELLSGHMPPWSVDSAPGRFRNVQMLSGRELNVLLTWVSGGTPPGESDTAHAAIEPTRSWPLGTPDLVLPLPQQVTLSSEMQEHVAEFTIALPDGAPRVLRAVDLLPGTASIVRSAVISTTGSGTAERVLTVWVPGDHPVPLDEGAAFVVPSDGGIRVQVRYRKTWEYERREMTDRSEVGLYFAGPFASEVRALELTPAGITTREPMRAVAIYPDTRLAHAHVTVVATRPNGSREELIAFRPQAGWARRYWFAESIVLPAGTRIDVNVASSDEDLLPPGALPPQSPDPSAVRLTLNVIPE